MLYEVITVLHGEAAWAHLVGKTAPSTTASFANANTTANALSLTSQAAPQARDALEIGTGLDFVYEDGVTFGLGYMGQIAKESDSHAVQGRLNVAF